MICLINWVKMIEQKDKSLELSPKFIQIIGYLDKINAAKNDEEKEKIVKELGVDPLQLKKEFVEVFTNETKSFQEDAIKQIKIKQKEIRFNEDILKILKSINAQNPKIKELIQKEVELIDFLKKEKLFLSRFNSFMHSIEEILPSMEPIGELKKEIEDLAKELKAEGIL